MVLSSASKCSSIQESHPRKLPNVIDYYNQTKGGVDVMDRMVGNYSVKYKSKRWHVTIFCNLLDIACLNAFVLYNEVFPEENKSHRRRLFLISLGTNLSADYRNSRCQMPRQISMSNPHPALSSARRARCSECWKSKVDRKTKYICCICKTPLCLQHSQFKCYLC